MRVGLIRNDIHDIRLGRSLTKRIQLSRSFKVQKNFGFSGTFQSFKLAVNDKNGSNKSTNKNTDKNAHGKRGKQGKRGKMHEDIWLVILIIMA